jgi:hypothetical protein
MKRLIQILATVAIATLAVAPAARAEFGLKNFSAVFLNEDGTPATQAGSHPFAVTNTFDVNTKLGTEVAEQFPDGALQTARFPQPAGFIGSRTAVPTCATADFLAIYEFPAGTGVRPSCPNATAVGLTKVYFGRPNVAFIAAVYNLVPAPGEAARLGFIVNGGIPVTVDVGVEPRPPYNLTATAANILQQVNFYGSELTLWGVPAAHSHDSIRGTCLNPFALSPGELSLGTCNTGAAEVPFLTLPRSCQGPLLMGFEAFSWQEPNAAPNVGSFQAPGMTGCSKLGFGPAITAKPTSLAAESPTGLDFSLDVHDEGITNPTGLAQSDVRKAVVTLPEGFTTNPSQAEGLNICTEADLARETLNSAPGAGCPNASKIGTVEVESPLIEEALKGSLFVAEPYQNQFGSLLAVYLVFKNPTLGIIVKQALKVENDPVTGRITTVADDIPQLPFSHFRLHFREGTRSPLATPPGCGTYNASAVLTPWSGGLPITTTSAFEIITGPGGGACPTGNTPPFHPGLEAGTLNNAAGRYSPFYLRLSRNDGEQEFTHFSIKLPPGISGKLAGIPFCPDAAIAAAKARTGPHGGQEELNSPSCPAASEVGHTLAGAGVGPSLAYAPGKVYLAGPYNGSALSIAAITAAKVGPFDLGTVVIRSALKINPETAEVFIDATGSDAIPHIIKGIPVHARDIRVYVDKPDFVLNPTNCERTSTASTVLGSGLNFGSDFDDQPITVTSPFQAADCASLGFAPKLDLSLKGSTKRGGTPKFKAVLTARPGDANVGEAQVTLPHSEFLEQAHIKTICTRVQFKEGVVPGEKCPAASVYGYAKATTPLLDEPLQGPVYLRSSSHNLPDLVAALNSGKINIALAGHIDSVKGGRIRNTFEAVPDAPVTKFTLEMQGGKKGLLVNSTNLCKSTNRAISHFIGQNGKVYDTKPVLKADCKKAKKQKKNAKRHARTAG